MIDPKQTTDQESRRNVLRYLGLGVIASSFGWLFHRAWVNGQCIGHSQCRKCMANTKCELPLAIKFRKGDGEHKHHNHENQNDKLKGRSQGKLNEQSSVEPNEKNKLSRKNNNG